MDKLTDGQTLLQKCEDATNNKLRIYRFVFILSVYLYVTCKAWRIMKKTRLTVFYDPAFLRYAILMISGCLNVILRILKVYSYDRTTVRKVGRKPICDGVQKRLIRA